MKLVRAQRCSRAQQLRGAQPFTVSIYECHTRVRGCLTLTIAPNGARTCRFSGLRTSLSRHFRYSAHASNVAGCRMLVVHSNRSGWRSIKRAVRHRNLVAIAPRLGEPSRCFRFAFLVSKAARLRHGRDTAVSRPGLQLGRAGDAISPASQSGHLREPSLALTRPWSPIGFGSRQVTRFAQIASSPLPHCSALARRQTHQLCARSILCRTQLR